MTKAENSVWIGRNVIQSEIDGLLSLKRSIDADFERAANLLLNCSGHVIVVGLGKSGHVARKIASTLASTGTPAFFLHPTEAAHGDLGMITENSVVLGISNSGESNEVNVVMTFAKTLGSQTIAISSNKTSTLAKTADIALILPSAKEACPNNLAPTTSTTLTLALGDALCIAVMDLRGFTADDFGKRHPAGKLGFGLQKLGDYISTQERELPLIDRNSRVQDVIFEMTKGGKGCVGVTMNNELVGIITDGDLRRAMSDNVMTKVASDIMTSDPFILSPHMRLDDAISALKTRQIGNAFVIQDKVVVGLLDMKTLLATGNV